MKKLLFIGALLCVLSSCGSGNSKKTAESADVQEEMTELADVYDDCDECEEFDENEDPFGEYNGHDWVDLGLPCGAKWATCNVGAEKPEDCGNRYEWGKTTPKSYCWCGLCGDYDDYDHDSQSDNSNGDAAAANWGGNWRVPTMEEFQELIDCCTWEWTTQNDQKGFLVTGPTSQSIFLPAAGYHAYASGCGENPDSFYYWSSSPGERNSKTGEVEDGFSLCFSYHDDCITLGSQWADVGFPVRPVFVD